MDNYDFDGRPISAGAAFLQALKQDPSLKADPSTDAEDDDYHESMDYEADPQEVADDLARVESWRHKALSEYFGQLNQG